MNQWIGLRENLQETMGFSHEIWCFPVEFPLNQSIDIMWLAFTWDNHRTFSVGFSDRV